MDNKKSRGGEAPYFLYLKLFKIYEKEKVLPRYAEGLHAVAKRRADYLLLGKLEARIGVPPISIGSGESLKKCLFISAPVIGPITPALLKRALFPAGQSHGKSLFPVSITPVPWHLSHILNLLSFNAVLKRTFFFYFLQWLSLSSIRPAGVKLFMGRAHQDMFP